MKIGIMTFHASHNCGSMLQAFALQQTLIRKYGADVEIIDFANQGSKAMYGYFDFRPKKSAIRHNLNSIKYFSTIKNSRRDYNDFLNNYLLVSNDKYSKASEMKECSKKYDMLIAGGDQVWNVRCADGGKEYYLNFAKDIRKIAYSPSLGGSNIFTYADDLEEYKRLLCDFEKLSVREPNGKKWIEKLTDRNVDIVADPTLLLTADEWIEWLPVEDVKEEYIFNYAFFHNRKETNDVLMKISENLHMPMYVIDQKSYEIYKLDKYGMRKYPHTGPLAFLALMKNASLVLTQSFHGTLFSALFNRKFWSYNWKGVHNEDDDRATAILQQFGLEDRYVMIDDILSKDLLADIDYDKVNLNIQDLRRNAFEYIDSFMK